MIHRASKSPYDILSSTLLSSIALVVKLIQTSRSVSCNDGSGGDEGKELQKHVHKDFDRTARRTQESVYVKRGSMRVDLYTEELKKFKEFNLFEGDLAVFAYGGHGYVILENDTQIIETKNGPFIDVETDKTKF